MNIPILQAFSKYESVTFMLESGRNNVFNVNLAYFLKSFYYGKSQTQNQREHYNETSLECVIANHEKWLFHKS